MLKRFRPSFFAAASLFLVSALCAAQAAPNPNGKTVAERLGYPANSRLLVIHADDFGMMHTVNHAIEDAFAHHWVTSASVMVPCPWFPEVARWAKSHPGADLGIHLTLNADWTSYRWRPVSSHSHSSLVDKDGYLPLLAEYVDQHATISDVETELRAQVAKAEAAGIRPSHMDSHMGTLYSPEPLFQAYLGLGRQLHIPLLLSRKPSDDITLPLPAGINRDAVPIDKVMELTHNPGKDHWLETYEQMLASLPPGTYELIVHLAYDDGEIQAATFDHPDWGAQWRQNDLNMVSSPAFQKFLKDQHFILVSWQDLDRSIPASARW